MAIVDNCRLFIRAHTKNHIYNHGFPIIKSSFPHISDVISGNFRGPVSP